MNDTMKAQLALKVAEMAKAYATDVFNTSGDVAEIMRIIGFRDEMMAGVCDSAIKIRPLLD